MAVPDQRASERRGSLLIGSAAVAWAAWRAGLFGDVINGRGWPSLASFWRAALSPELDGAFVRLTADAAVTTLALAVLGTMLSIVLGAAGALVTSQLLWRSHPVRKVALGVLALPRSIHEVIWALLLVQVFGFTPIVAVLAIGIPFGAVTAKVFAEAIDEADRNPYESLRVTGAGRMQSLTYGVLPTVRGDLLAYSFYRLECAVRSAAVLGVVGVGGLGFQLDVSFETLRYHEIWTLIFALVILSGLIDQWSTLVRRSTERSVSRWSLIAATLLVPASAVWVGLDVSALWNGRTADRTRDLVQDLLPPRLGLGGWNELVGATIDTVALSILALLIAAGGGFAFALLSRRRTERLATTSPPQQTAGWLTRLALLLARAVPAPMWAFLAVLVLFPGLWPGAVGLGIYNLGVLGRLFADTIEDGDTAAADQLLATGASPTTALFYGTIPTVLPRLVAISLYRWEVIVRETVVVGVVGAGGLGQLINDHLVARDFAAVTGALLALTGLAIAVDALGSRLRTSLR